MIAFALLAPSAALADSGRYAIQMTILNNKGVQKFFANNGATYSRDECLLQKRAWERENVAFYEAAANTLRAQGEKAEFSVDCTQVPEKTP